MTAQSLQVITLDIQNPEWSEKISVQRVNTSVAYSYLTSYHIVTLSDSGANNANDVTGLLYTPDLNHNDSCVNSSAAWVPQNATRQSNLPLIDYNLIAIAPWVSAECTLNWFAAARNDPIRGFILFFPDNENPPAPSDSIYNLQDSLEWKLQNDWPVYVVPASTGKTLMSASARYSGNMTDVPYGHQLAENFDSRDYVRLYVDINTGSSGDELPTIWMFLLVVFGILAGVFALTSVALHWLNRRRRLALRRRVATGEVDLEALGIKRLVVPQHILDHMPLYTYGTSQRNSDSGLDDVLPNDDEEKDQDISPLDIPNSTTARPAPAVLPSTSPTPLSTIVQQPSCAICWDDFVSSSNTQTGSDVRELPCRHIFHPECIDSFLRDTSSLCPICKKSTLPIGYCPRTVTNAMVRRERIVRRIRERVSLDSLVDDAEDEDADFLDEVYHDNPLPAQEAGSLGRRFRDRTVSSFSQLTNARRSGSMPSTTVKTLESGAQNNELIEFPPTSAIAPPQNGSAGTPSSCERSSTHHPPSSFARREWARLRAETMLGRRPPLDPDDDRESLRRVSPWKKVVKGIFPL